MSIDAPSCLLDGEEILGVLTRKHELVADDQAVGARLLLLVSAANDAIERRAAA